MSVSAAIRQLVRLALAEDIGSGDITTSRVVNPSSRVQAAICAKSPGILAGVELAKFVMKSIDKRIEFEVLVADGGKLKKGKRVALIRGRAGSILTTERTALNFLQRLSGIATLTNHFVGKTGRFKVKIYDTRKTTPGWRELEKYAVRMGGGKSHRKGLFDQILIKNNHIRVAGSIGQAVKLARAKKKKREIIEVETSNLGEVKEALGAGADWIMLDNMSVVDMRKAIAWIRTFSKRRAKKIIVEASGNVNLGNVAQIAQTGVDLISVGQLTHSAPALDFSLKIIKPI